ncbi:MAG: amidohydrolase, partial [Bilophila wadsworthia]
SSPMALMAFKAMGELMPALDQERHKALVRECVAEYNAQGFTSAHDSAVGIGNLSAETVYRTYNQLYESGELNMRVYLATMEQPFRRLEPTGLLDGPGNRFVQYSAVKTLADGSIQAGTAAIPEGYFFDPSLRPGIIGTQDYWDEMVYHWHSRGRQLSIHCNGVGAIETIITAVERAQARCPRKDARHLIIHCQMATDEHVRRMKEAGILPSFYGLHVWNWGDRHRDIFLGPDRAARLDPAGSAVRAGLPFSLHADTPVLPQMTMLSIHTAVNRETKGGAVLGPDQRISTLEAVRAYTSYAALFSHSEAWRGTIEPGKVADFVIPSEDILEAPAGRLKGITFAAVIVDNRVVHGQLP